MPTPISCLLWRKEKGYSREIGSVGWMNWASLSSHLSYRGAAMLRSWRHLQRKRFAIQSVLSLSSPSTCLCSRCRIYSPWTPTVGQHPCGNTGIEPARGEILRERWDWGQGKDSKWKEQRPLGQRKKDGLGIKGNRWELSSWRQRVRFGKRK